MPGIFVLTGQAAATKSRPARLLAVTLPADTWLRFAIWMVLGLHVYVLYARRSSAVSAARG